MEFIFWTLRPSLRPFLRRYLLKSVSISVSKESFCLIIIKINFLNPLQNQTSDFEVMSSQPQTKNLDMHNNMNIVYLSITKYL
jgi:hypothetical protein